MIDDSRKNGIIKQKADNENIKPTKIAVDFQAKFNRPITRQCISQVGVGEILPCKWICVKLYSLKMIQIVNRNVDTYRK